VSSDPMRTQNGSAPIVSRAPSPVAPPATSQAGSTTPITNGTQGSNISSSAMTPQQIRDRKRGKAAKDEKKAQRGGMMQPMVLPGRRGLNQTPGLQLRFGQPGRRSKHRPPKKD